MSIDEINNFIKDEVRRALDDANLMAVIGYKVGSEFGDYAILNKAKPHQSHVYGLMQAIESLSSTSDSARAAFTQVINGVEKQGFEVKTDEVHPSNFHITVKKDDTSLVVSLGIVPRSSGVSADIVSATKADEDMTPDNICFLVYEKIKFEKAHELLSDDPRPPSDVASTITTIMEYL